LRIKEENEWRIGRHWKNGTREKNVKREERNGGVSNIFW